MRDMKELAEAFMRREHCELITMEKDEKGNECLYIMDHEEKPAYYKKLICDPTDPRTIGRMANLFYQASLEYRNRIRPSKYNVSKYEKELYKQAHLFMAVKDVIEEFHNKTYRTSVLADKALEAAEDLVSYYVEAKPAQKEQVDKIRKMVSIPPQPQAQASR